MLFFENIFFFLCIFFSLNIIGFIFNYKNLDKDETTYSNIIYGLSIVIILENILYFYLNFSTSSIKNTVLIIIITIFFFTVKKKMLKNFIKSSLKSLVLSLPIFLFLSATYAIYGDNLIIFRGNQWDYFHYLTQSLIVLKNNYQDLINNPYQLNAIYVNDRPTSYLNIALIKEFTNLEIFKTGFLYKSFCISLAANGFSALIINFFSKKKFIIFSSIFSFSFWIFYIYEIDAVAHLGSISIVLLLTSLILKIISEKKLTQFSTLKISIISSALFLIYPEIFCIFFLIYILMFILIEKKIFYLKREFLSLSFIGLLFFFLFTLSNYNTYLGILEKVLSTTKGEPLEFWNYYGAFFLGKESIILDNKVVNLLKENIASGFDHKTILEILRINYLNGFEFFVLNILTSFFGLFIVTIGKNDNSILFYINFIVLFLLNISVIIFFLKENYLKDARQRFKLLFKSVIIIFTCLSLFFFIKKGYWQIIKLYFFLSPFIYLLLIINKKKIFSYCFIIITCLTPIYQYSVNNNGIGKINSFPAIINSEYKTKFNWDVNLENCNSDSSIEIDKSRYNIHKYFFVNLKIYDLDLKKIKNNQLKKCVIKENGEIFLVTTQHN
jgi:hypothetical protein